MQVKYARLVGPEYMLAAMRTTTGKSMYEAKLPKLETWFKMLLSSHSSPRAALYRIYIEDIPYFSHVHLIRHHVGFQPHVFSQRDDEGAVEVSPRNSSYQDVPVSMCADVNAAAILQIAQKRLCYKAHRVVQEVMRKLKISLLVHGDAYDRVLSKLMMRPCEWYPNYCSEPSPCGRVLGVKSLFEVHHLALESARAERLI